MSQGSQSTAQWLRGSPSNQQTLKLSLHCPHLVHMNLSLNWIRALWWPTKLLRNMILHHPPPIRSSLRWHMIGHMTQTTKRWIQATRTHSSKRSCLKSILLCIKVSRNMIIKQEMSTSSPSKAPDSYPRNSPWTFHPAAQQTCTLFTTQLPQGTKSRWTSSFLFFPSPRTRWRWC